MNGKLSATAASARRRLRFRVFRKIQAPRLTRATDFASQYAAVQMATIPELHFADYTHAQPGRREAFTDALMRGLQHYGFILLRDHPVPASLLEHAYHLTAAFFVCPDRVHASQLERGATLRGVLHRGRPQVHRYHGRRIPRATPATDRFTTQAGAAGQGRTGQP